MKNRNEKIITGVIVFSFLIIFIVLMLFITNIGKKLCEWRGGKYIDGENKICVFD